MRGPTGKENWPSLWTVAEGERDEQKKVGEEERRGFIGERTICFHALQLTTAAAGLSWFFSTFGGFYFGKISNYVCSQKVSGKKEKSLKK